MKSRPENSGRIRNVCGRRTGYTGVNPYVSPILLTILCSVLLLLCAYNNVYPGEWWNNDWMVRITVRAGTEQKSGFTSFYVDNNGTMKPDGSDFRAVDPEGKELPLLVYPDSPKGMFLVVCKHGSTGMFHLYYGNPHTEQGKKWEADRGLMLVTFAHSGKGTGRRADVSLLLNDKGLCFGRDFVPAVFHGANPFGTSDRYLGIYTGYFSVDRDGEYVFATASDDASFMSIDGKEIVSWPGKHNVRAGMRGRFRAKITLKKGIHSIRYDHIEYTGGQVAAAYIQRPGEHRLDVLRFPVPEKALFIQIETRDNTYEPFMRVRETGEIDAEGTLYMVVAECAAPKGASDYEWDMGDGNRLTGRTVRHIYLWEGVYTVTLHYTAGGRERTSSVTRYIRFNGQRKEYSQEIDFFSAVCGYDFAEIGIEGYAKILKYSVRSGRTPSQEFLGKAEDLFPEFKVANVIDIADMYITNSNYSKALYFIQKGLERFVKKEERASLLIKKGDIYFYYLKNLPEAVRVYREVTGNPFLKGWGDFRLAFIRLGDVYRERNHKGDFDLAMVYYTKAEDLNTQANAALRNGYYTHGVLDLIKGKDYDNALRMLEDWEYNFPTEKLRGFSSLQRGRINYLNGKYDETVKQAKNFILVNPSTTYIADFYMLIGAACYKKGESEQSLKYYSRVVTLCPESPKGRQAEKIIKRLRALPQLNSTSSGVNRAPRP